MTDMGPNKERLLRASRQMDQTESDIHRPPLFDQLSLLLADGAIVSEGANGMSTRFGQHIDAMARQVNSAYRSAASRTGQAYASYPYEQ